MMAPMAASLIAPIASSSIQPVASLLINAISGKGVMRAGLHLMMKVLGKGVKRAGKEPWEHEKDILIKIIWIKTFTAAPLFKQYQH